MKLNNSKLKIYKSILLLLLTSTLLPLASFLLLLTSCDTTNPPSNNKITLTFEDASCTEAWLNLKLQNVSLPTTIKITERDSTFLTTTINSNDTTLFIENLLPNRTYSFYSTIPSFQNSSAIKSKKVSVTTMDTTSHDFTWQTFTFGNRYSMLKDVAIINENNIWAVGEIHTAETDQFDSNGVWVQPYNAVHWDGSKWELKRILFYIDPFQPGAGRTASEAVSIFSFGENDFVVSSNAQIAFFNTKGNYIVRKMDFKWEDLYTINSIWGTSSKDFYVVGYGGNIAHYNGSSWKKIESGTELNFYDIYGDYNSKTNKWEVLAVASNIVIDEGNKLISINNHTSTALSTEGLRWAIQTIWFKTKRKYLIGGDGLFETNSVSNTWEVNKLVPSIYTVSLSGTDVNDVFSTGPFGMVLHYNGITWRDYTNETKYKGVCYGATSINNNLVAIPGATSNQGVILIGRR